jgi:hypothetical protein
MIAICDHIAASVGQLFTCSDEGNYVRVRTPFLYPDGDVIDLYARNGGPTITLTDFGETLRWLRMQALSKQRSPKQQKMIQDVLSNHGVELYKGMLMARANNEAEIGPTVFRLAQAALRVADIWFTFRTRAFESVADDVEEFLTARSVSFDRGEQLVGRSGRVYRPDFHTRTTTHSALVNVLTTGSKAAAKGVVDHVVAAWYDLNHLKIGPEGLKFVSLFDDTSDVWSENDLALLGDLSDVAFWSKPDDFLQLVAA